MTSYVPLAVPSIGPRERELVLEAVDSGYVSSVGPFVSRFEEEFAAAVGARHAVACASGTAAIHLALQVLGVGTDDLVAVADFTFVGSVNPVRYLGAEALFVDSERRTWNLDPTLLVAELNRRARTGERLPKVVEVVHALGQPAELGPALEVCDRLGIAVLEDAAESLGATWTFADGNGGTVVHHTGTRGRIGAFSFNGNKIVTTGGGGMLVTDEGDLAAHARHLSTQAKVPGVGYLHDEVGYNYRLTNVAAALGIAQLERLPEFVRRKREIAVRYDAALGGLGDQIVLPPRLPGFDSTYWLYSVLVDAEHRDQVLARLEGTGIGARALWRPLHQQPPFADTPVVAEQGGQSVGAELFARGLSLPCSADLTQAEQDRVISAVSAALAAVSRRAH
jgi:dTDP-4-amino-4,6-dideoxygalactose transaminase